MAPKVLISDSLSEAAVQIFRDRGIDVDFEPTLGKDKEKLAEVIGNYDGLAIRSATKATAALIEKADNLKVIGRRRNRHRQRRQRGGIEEGRDRNEHAVRQHDHPPPNTRLR